MDDKQEMHTEVGAAAFFRILSFQTSNRLCAHFHLIWEALVYLIKRPVYSDGLRGALTFVSDPNKVWGCLLSLS